jgi:AAA15 family ATPase/GTPase
MYKQITIEGLRGIKHLKIEDFGRVNLFVGKNNCGKTTLLEGIFLLTGPTNAQLPLIKKQLILKIVIPDYHLQ